MVYYVTALFPFFVSDGMYYACMRAYHTSNGPPRYVQNAAMLFHHACLSIIVMCSMPCHAMPYSLSQTSPADPTIPYVLYNANAMQSLNPLCILLFLFCSCSSSSLLGPARLRKELLLLLWRHRAHRVYAVRRVHVWKRLHRRHHLRLHLLRSLRLW